MLVVGRFSEYPPPSVGGVIGTPCPWVQYDNTIHPPGQVMIYHSAANHTPYVFGLSTHDESFEKQLRRFLDPVTIVRNVEDAVEMLTVGRFNKINNGMLLFGNEVTPC
eukprot:sb/3477534/